MRSLFFVINTCIIIENFIFKEATIMKYLLVFVDEKERIEKIVEECLEKQEAIEKAENLHPNEDGKYYVVMDEELKEVVYESWWIRKK